MSRLAMLCKIHHGQAAVRTTSLTLKQLTRAQREHDQAYMISTCRTDYRKYSFIRTVREWNTLPAKTVSAPILGTFVSRLTCQVSMVGKLSNYTIHYPGQETARVEDVKNSFEIRDKFEAELLPEAHCPVVILLGWAGCQEKHLAKYMPMYEKKGFIILYVLVPARTLFFQPHKLLEVAQGLLKLLREKNISDNRIFFHVFSNGGSTVYMHLTSLLNNEGSGFQNVLRVCGVIFDSAPGKSRIFFDVQAFMGTLEMHPVLRYLWGFCLLVYLIVTRVLLQLLPFGFKSSKGLQVFNRVCEDPTQCPQLFLYSKADHLIMAEDVEEAIARRKARGVHVKSVCWDDSAHVSHLRTHPEVYTKVCLDFMTACLEKGNNGKN